MAWSNSHRPQPHSGTNLRERSQRTAADLVVEHVQRTLIAGGRRSLGRPATVARVTVTSCKNTHNGTRMHKGHSLVQSDRSVVGGNEKKIRQGPGSRMAQTTSRLWSPLAAECFGKLCGADWSSRHTPSIHTSTLKSRPWLWNPWQASQHYVRHMSVLYCANTSDCN